jgi:signal transduction histidine kinase
VARATVLLAAVALVVGFAVEPFDEGVAWIPDLLTGWALAGCGIAAARVRPRSPIGPLLAVSGVLWFVGWPGVLAYRTPLALAVLTPPERRRPSLSVAVLSVALAITPLAQSLPGAIALAAATLLVGVRQRSVLPSAAVLGVSIAGAAIVTHALSDAPALAVMTAYGAGLALAGVTAVFTVIRAEWEPVELAEALAAPTTIEAFRVALADAVADPSLLVAFSVPDPRPGRELTVVADGAEPVAWLQHRPGALADPALRDAVSIATRLQAANVRLQRDLVAQADALAASGRRLLAASDEQRRRLERRVHTGPLGRLEALDARLVALDSPVLNRARADLATSIDELRTLAFGLHPGVDVGAALAALAARSPVAVHVDAGDVPELPVAARSALVFSCSEALANVVKHAAATRVEIRLVRARETVTLSVADDGRGGADPSAGTGLLGLRDRLELLGGTLAVASSDGAGTRLVATVPST